MSVTFHIASSDGMPLPHPGECAYRREYTQDELFDSSVPVPVCEWCDRTSVNMANVNAYDLLRWLGLPAHYAGDVKASEVAAICRRRLWDEPRNHDEGISPAVDGRVTYCGREPGYLRRRTEQVLALCEVLPEGMITWG